jgi:hypothetical protein
VEVDSFHNLSTVMREVSKIIVTELAAGNRIYINVSTSGKVAAIGATLAAMAHLPPTRGMVYFVVALDYPTDKDAQREHGLARAMDVDPIPIPIFPLNLPDSDCRLVLAELANASKPLAYTVLATKLGRSGVAPFMELAEPARSRADRTRIQVAFHRRIVSKLSTVGMVTVEKAGRERRLGLTLAGRQFAALCIPEWPPPSD